MTSRNWRAPLALFFGCLAFSGLGERSARAEPYFRRLDDMKRVPDGRHSHARILVDDNGQPQVLPAPPPDGFGPADLASAYHLPKSGGNGLLITTILGGTHYKNAEADLAKYRDAYGLPPCTKANGCFIQVDGKGGTDFASDGGCDNDIGETALDLDMLSAGCPDCKIMVVEPNGTSDGDAIKTAIGKGAVAISISWGYGENGVSQSDDKAWTHPGIAIFVATGDSGYFSPQQELSYPATSLGVVAVAGTKLKRSNSARGWDEVAWDGGGSGCSKSFDKPSWQTDTGCSKRSVADMSAISDNVAMYCSDSSGGGWMTAGGTSASAPYSAGMMTRLGVANGHFDPAWVWQNKQKFFDITSGSNGNCSGALKYLCNAGVGYDGPTGNGTPNGDLIAGDTSGGGSGGSGGAGGNAAGGAAGTNTGGANNAGAGFGGTNFGGANFGGAGGLNAGGANSAGFSGSGAIFGGGGAAGSAGASASGGQAGSGHAGSSNAGAEANPMSGSDNSGCSCSTPRRSSPSSALLVLGALGLVLAGVRRVRNGRRAR